MTNNKQQTEINAVEYLSKVNQFAKENNTDKPRQQTAVEWFIQELQKTRDYQRVINEANQSTSAVRDVVEQAKEMEKERMIEFAAQVFRNRYNEVYQSLTKVATDTYNETYK